MSSLNFFKVFWIAILVGIVYLLTKAMPPNEIVIKAGPTTYFFDRTAQHIKTELEKIGVSAKVINTYETVKIVEEVNQKDGPIDIGFAAQDLSKQKISNVESLGSIVVEPLFIFYRRELNLSSPADLKGLKLGIGPPGGGTRIVSEQVLKKFGITPQNAAFVPITQLQSIQALKEKKIDVGFFLQPTETPFIRNLGKDAQLSLLHIPSAEAVSRRIDYLQDIVVPQGAFSLHKNLPPKDTFGVGLPVTVVVNKEIDPSIAVMVSHLLKQTFGSATLISDANSFPSSLEPRLKLNRNAEAVLSSGLPYIFTVLPFSIAGVFYNIGLHLILLLGFAIIFNNIYSFAGFVSPLELWHKYRYKGDIAGLKQILSTVEANKALTDSQQKFVLALRKRYDVNRISPAQFKVDPILKNAHTEINQVLEKISVIDQP